MLLPFWIVKILTTAQGEALSDYLVHTINPYIAVALGFGGFAIALAIQLAQRRYRAWAYWFAVTMVAVFGTMAADAAHIELRLPYALTAGICATGLAAVFAVWYAVERTLSIHTVSTLRRELFYWAAVLATFAMGTALGDLSAYTFRWGFLVSGLVYTGLFALPFLLRTAAGLGEVLAFWSAYVMTRPLGASYADWLGVPRSLGGLDFGRGTVAIVLTAAIALMVAYLAATRLDEDRGDLGRENVRKIRAPESSGA